MTSLLTRRTIAKIYLIPSNECKKEDELFRDREYEGLKSEPEWGLISPRNVHLLERFELERMLKIRHTIAN